MRDDDDYRHFVLARAHALSRTAYLLTGDHHLAQDLLQTALAATYQHWHRIRAGNPEAYTRRALYHTHVSWWRRQRLSERPLPDDELLAHAVAPDTTETTEARMVIAEALRSLGARQRAVVVLRYYEDLTEAQTAAVLECSVGTVKRLHFDALARLRNLAPHLRGDEPFAVTTKAPPTRAAINVHAAGPEGVQTT